MLTIRKIRVASSDWRAARRAADYVIAEAEASMWLGTRSMLERLEVEGGARLRRNDVARALQGRSAETGTQVRTLGLIERPLSDEHGRPVFDDRGRRRSERVRGTKSVDLTFSAPKSVSVVWSQAPAPVRTGIEAAMIDAAGAMLVNMTQAKPVVAHGGALWPAKGHAAAVALHTMARAGRDGRPPAPQLHVHSIVVGVARADSFFASPELSGMFKHGAPLEGGAVGRARLAEGLVEIGFEIEQRGRFFEIAGVPSGLVERMSSRTRDVNAGAEARATTRGRALTNGERAVVAFETRAPKAHEPSREQTVASWAEQASAYGFGPTSVEALRGGSGFAGSARERRERLMPVLAERMRGARSIGEARAAIFEGAAGHLRLDEIRPALARLEATP